MLKKLVQDDLRLGATLQFHNNAHTIAARFVAHVGDIVNDLVIYQLRNALHDLRFVYLVGNFPHDDGLAALRSFVNGGFRAHHELPAAMRVSRFDSAASVNVSAGGKVRAFYDFQDLFQRRRGRVDQQNCRFHNFR